MSMVYVSSIITSILVLQKSMNSIEILIRIPTKPKKTCEPSHQFQEQIVEMGTIPVLWLPWGNHYPNYKRGVYCLYSNWHDPSTQLHRVDCNIIDMTWRHAQCSGHKQPSAHLLRHFLGAEASPADDAKWSLWELGNTNRVSWNVPQNSFLQ